jgi:purine-binding chemotaxis protein CheW
MCIRDRYISGVVNLRGQIVTVINLGKKLNPATEGANACSRVVVVRSGAEQIGLLIDTIEDAVVARTEDILSPPPNIKERYGPFLSGVYRTPESLVAVLDKTAILEKNGKRAEHDTY